MFVFRKIWCALFCWNTRFEIRPFALLPTKSTKIYWSILKSFLIDKNSKTDFKKKAELFNSFFANQCSLINNSNQLPLTLSYKTNKRLSLIRVIDDDILKIIAKLDQNESYGHDKISMRMIKIFSTSIYKPLRLVFNHCLDNGVYPCESRKAMCHFTKRWLTNFKKTIVQYFYFQFALKVFKDSYITRCLFFFLIRA